MYSSRQKETRISKSMPCPDCSAIRMHKVTANCRIENDLIVQNLRHFKCESCGALFFDDEAMRRIQAERSKIAVTT